MATTSTGFWITPDFDQLAGGVLTPISAKLEHRRGGPTAMDALGVRFAGPDTFAAWREVGVAELWQIVALQSFLVL